MLLREIMTAAVVTAGFDDDVGSVAQLMRGNLEVAQRMTQEVIGGALPEFFFHERG